MERGQVLSEPRSEKGCGRRGDSRAKVCEGGPSVRDALGSGRLRVDAGVQLKGSVRIWGRPWRCGSKLGQDGIVGALRGVTRDHVQNWRVRSPVSCQWGELVKLCRGCGVVTRCGIKV